jgi:RNA polymerase sigma-70 factor (ECF subfamily)
MPDDDRTRLLADLYDRWSARLFAAARNLLASPADAEDSVHDVFINLLRLPAPTDEAAYLFTALRHAVARRWRDRQRRRQVTADEAPEPATAGGGVPESDPELARAVASLSHEQRLVVALKVDADLTFAEIAAACGISANTAASRYRYALEHLRDRLRHRETP